MDLHFECQNCGNTIKVEQPNDKILRPIKCPCGKPAWLSKDISKEKELLDELKELEIDSYDRE